MKYILFGACNIGKDMLCFLGSDNVSFFCDNYKAGQMFENKEVISYEKLKDIYDDYEIIISVPERFVTEIALQLQRDAIPFVFKEEIGKRHIKMESQKYNEMNRRPSLQYDSSYDYYIFGDQFGNAGTTGVYFWQDLWGAKHVFERKPRIHSDIGSSISGFVAHLLAFGQRVRVFDIRPMKKISGVDFVQCDATNLDGIPDNSIESLSALCSLEHFGLGRFGDPIDPEACFKCMSTIQRKMIPGGRVYISVPVGKEHVEFNAHRVFYASTIKDAFSEMDLQEYSVTDDNGIEYNVDLHRYDNYTEKGAGKVGLFMFVKRYYSGY